MVDVGAGRGGGVPKVEGEQGAAHEVRLAGEELERLSDLDGGGKVDCGGEDACGIAGVDVAGGGFGEDAGEAGGGWRRFEVRGSRFEGLRQDVHGGGVGADGGGVDPGLALLDGEVVDKVTGLEVVGGVEDDVGSGEQAGDIGGDEVGDMRVDGDSGVELGNVAARGLGLGEISRASASSKRTWRWRLEGSTKSRSMRVSVPTPARASSDAEAAPMAPQPTMATCAWASRCWPAAPMPAKENLSGVAIRVRDGAGGGRDFLGRDLGVRVCLYSFKGIVVRSIGNCGTHFSGACAITLPAFRIRDPVGTCHSGTMHRSEDDQWR